ncbi:MAG: GH92 family glycosyl hydrolase [Ignavibacteria bacterium]|nr:GH92 family glycosyl hydrolase [Ignavibacteria bacterium]
MKKLITVFFTIFLSAFSYPQDDLTKYVNPFIGTDGHGHTFPGASLPFGMVQLSPDTRLTGWDGCSGYHYSDDVIYGFSHTHLSGTGVSDYGDILLMPMVNDLKFSNKDYSSGFSKSSEFASAGYYSVFLDKYNIKAELTVTKRAGIHKYIFPANSMSNIILDLVHRDSVLDSKIEYQDNNEIRGYRISRNWAKEQHVYFVIRFSKPFLHFGICENGKLTDRKNSANGNNLKCYAGFTTDNNEVIYVKVGISGVSIEGAIRNLDEEIPGWDFDKVRTDAKSEWNSQLNKIIVESKNEDEKTVFYTALYHCLLSPNIYTDVDGQYRGTDLKIHKAEDFDYYTVFSLWDTYRAEHPLLTIIDTGRSNDFINTFISQYENGGMFPVWELSGNETFCMIGYHSIPVITDAYVKGIRGYDTEKVFRYMKETSNRNIFGSDAFRQYGFVPQDIEHESVSKTLEYAYDDWCISEMARLMNKEEDYKEYINRAQYYKNIFNPSTGFMQAKINGGFYEPFDPAEVNNNYTEANAWQYTFYVPHDIKGLSELYGGDDNFSNKIQELFTTFSKMTGREQVDITGLIGQYAHGNEPSHHISYLFDYIGKPNITQYYVNRIMKEFYKNSPDGLIGNEDCGQMSAWFVLSAMGFYPVCPGSLQYAIGIPLFDKVTINLENGNKFEIIANNQSEENYFIGGMRLNDAKYLKYYIEHEEIMKGGKLEFDLTSEPSREKILPANLPYSRIKDNLIVPVPYFSTPRNTFRDKMQVEIKSIGKNVKIYYTVNAMEKTEELAGGIYDKPLDINTNCVINAYCENSKGERSLTATAKYYKIPDYEVTLYSLYNLQYTAGGSEGLIDGIRGKENWRLGGWQGYQGKDFVAVVDLKNSGLIKSITAGFLQDIRSWIWMPVKIYYDISEDGVNFTNVAEITNDVQNNDYNSDVIIKDYPFAVEKNARYVRVRAVNFGKIPEWHPGFGSDAFLFVDEIIIK